MRLKKAVEIAKQNSTEQEKEPQTVSAELSESGELPSDDIATWLNEKSTSKQLTAGAAEKPAAPAENRPRKPIVPTPPVYHEPVEPESAKRMTAIEKQKHAAKQGKANTVEEPVVEAEAEISATQEVEKSGLMGRLFKRLKI